MDRTRIPKDGVNPYEDHPGFDAQACELQRTVTRRGAYGQIISGGFGCYATGGHCLPDGHCEKRRIECSEDFQRAP